MMVYVLAVGTALTVENVVVALLRHAPRGHTDTPVANRASSRISHRR